MTTNTNTTNTRKETLISRIVRHGIDVDTIVKFEGRYVFRTSTDHKIYIFNPETKKASVYNEDGSGYAPITVNRFATQKDALLQRVKKEVETAQRIRENVERFEAKTGTDHNAILLDAEREDSKFDYRRAEDVLSRSEPESYEETDSLLDEDKNDLTGYHKATLVQWENVKGKTITASDGSQKFYKPYILMTFEVDGELIPSRAYMKQFESFKIQMNQKHQGIFRFMKDSVALDELVSTEVDIWLKWNELLRVEGSTDPGMWQAEFYDVEAYRARKAREAQMSNVRGGYGRPTENKATR